MSDCVDKTPNNVGNQVYLKSSIFPNLENMMVEKHFPNGQDCAQSLKHAQQCFNK